MGDTRATPIVDVLLRVRFPGADLVELRRHLETIGMAPRARVRTMPVRRDPGELGWTILLVVALSAFAGAVGTQLGRDAYRGLSELVRRVANRDADPAEHPHRTLIVARDRDSWVEAVLDPDLPTEAFAQLRDLTVADGERVRWDGRRRRWRRHADLPPR